MPQVEESMKKDENDTGEQLNANVEEDKMNQSGEMEAPTAMEYEDEAEDDDEEEKSFEGELIDENQQEDCEIVNEDIS